MRCACPAASSLSCLLAAMPMRHGRNHNAVAHPAQRDVSPSPLLCALASAEQMTSQPVITLPLLLPQSHFSPLHWAVASASGAECVQLLLCHGANKNPVDKVLACVRACWALQTARSNAPPLVSTAPALDSFGGTRGDHLVVI